MQLLPHLASAKAGLAAVRLACQHLHNHTHPHGLPLQQSETASKLTSLLATCTVLL
jgi:hypothetical protein